MKGYREGLKRAHNLEDKVCLVFSEGRSGLPDPVPRSLFKRMEYEKILDLTKSLDQELLARMLRVALGKRAEA